MLYIKDSYASKFSEIAEFWGDKMPIMACEEFAELQEPIMRYTASKYSDRAEKDCKRRISEEVADVIISIYATGAHFNVAPQVIYTCAMTREGSRMVEGGRSMSMVLFALSKAIQIVSKRVRAKAGNEDLAAVFVELLVYMWYMVDELDIESDLLDRRLPAKLDKEYE